MTAAGGDRVHEWFGRSFEDILREVSVMAAQCEVQLLEPGVIARVLHNDASVCGRKNQVAFDKMRALLMLHYKLRGRAVEALGEAEAQAIIDHVVADLRRVWNVEDQAGR